MALLIAYCYKYGFYAVLALGSLIAFWRGSWPERPAATAMMTAAIATLLLRSPYSVRWSSPEWPIFVVDSLLLFALLALAMRSRRNWLTWAAALQTITIIGHLASFLDVDLSVNTYALMAGASAYPIALMLAIAAWRHRRPISTTSAG